MNPSTPHGHLSSTSFWGWTEKRRFECAWASWLLMTTKSTMTSSWPHSCYIVQCSDMPTPIIFLLTRKDLEWVLWWIHRNVVTFIGFVLFHPSLVVALQQWLTCACKVMNHWERTRSSETRSSRVLRKNSFQWIEYGNIHCVEHR